MNTSDVIKTWGHHSFRSIKVELELQKVGSHLPNSLSFVSFQSRLVKSSSPPNVSNEYAKKDSTYISMN